MMLAPINTLTQESLPVAKQTLKPDVPPKVLTEDDWKLLTEMRRSIAHTREFLTSCKDCQIDVQAEIDLNEQQASIVGSLLAKHFPDRP